MRAAFAPDISFGRRVAGSLTWPLIKRRVIGDFGIDELAVEHAFRKLRDAGERFQVAVGPDGYLVDHGFTVADLTLAALAAPIVAPEQFPYPQPQRGHPLIAPVVDALAESGLADWARSMYARHRGMTAEVAPDMTAEAAA
jgi:hypothetical protein